MKQLTILSICIFGAIASVFAQAGYTPATEAQQKEMMQKITIAPNMQIESIDIFFIVNYLAIKSTPMITNPNPIQRVNDTVSWKINIAANIPKTYAKAVMG